jgi:hypothetical protein
MDIHSIKFKSTSQVKVAIFYIYVSKIFWKDLKFLFYLKLIFFILIC